MRPQCADPLVREEAERLEGEFGMQIVSLACDMFGFDVATALSTYARDGVPWYVTKEKAARLGLSIEEQLCSLTRKAPASFGCGEVAVRSAA